MLYLAVATLLFTSTPDDEAPIIEDDSAEGEFGLPSFETAPENNAPDETEEEPGHPARKKHHQKKSRHKRVVPEYRGVGLLSLGAGVGATAAGIQFDADLFGSGGVMFRPGIAIVGLANVQIMPSAMGVTQRYGLGAGVRFGRHTHLTLGTTANILYTRRYGPEFAGTVIVQVFGLIKSRFGFVLTPTFTWSAHMVLFSVTLGLGVNF